jgi:hypothetical protein
MQMLLFTTNAWLMNSDLAVSPELVLLLVFSLLFLPDIL